MPAMHIDDLLHFVVTAHEDAGPVVDMFGDDGQHAFHAAIDGLAAGYVGVSLR